MAVRIGVALSSGGAAGLAHIGVLEELVGAGIAIDCIVGSSAGAMVGAAFAAGHLDEFHAHVMASSLRRRLMWFDPIWPRSGLLGGRRAMDLLAVCASGLIEDLPLRYAAVATDLDSGQRVTLSSGDVCRAVRASIAIPGVFTPQPWRGRLLVDGALVDPVPVGPARQLGATFVIAVSVIGSEGTYLSTQRFAAPSVAGFRQLVARAVRRIRPPTPPVAAVAGENAGDAIAMGDAERNDGLAAILHKASAVVQTTIAAARLQENPPDFLIAPAAYDIGVFDLWRAAEAIEAGRAAARDALPELRAMIAEARGRSRSWWSGREAAAGHRVAA